LWTAIILNKNFVQNVVGKVYWSWAFFNAIGVGFIIFVQGAAAFKTRAIPPIRPQLRVPEFY
jgi:hypothetical protein